MKDSEQIKFIISSIPQLAETLSPLLNMASKYITAMDIVAVKQIMDAGLTADQAIALRLGRMTCGGTVFTEAFKAANKARA